MNHHKESKASIRQTMRSKRQSLSAVDRLMAGNKLFKQLEKHHVLSPHTSVASFLSFDGEISTQSLNRQLLKQNKRYYLPKLRPNQSKQLWFMPYQENTHLRTNRFHIPEVDLLPNHAIAISKLDLVLLPLVAFDQRGYRLGMGGGFYDATFAHLRGSHQKPLLVGLAYAFQQIETVPIESWDLPLDAVCTNDGFYPKS